MMTSNQTTEDKLKNNDNLRLITIRISQEAYDTASDLAEEYNMSISAIMRIAIDASFERYLGQIRYIDPEQGKAINHNILALANTLVEIRDQLRRIGVNYNREVRLRNARRQKAELEEREKASARYSSSYMLMTLEREKAEIEKEIDHIMADTKLLDRDELEGLIHMVDDSIKEFSENICTVKLK